MKISGTEKRKMKVEASVIERSLLWKEESREEDRTGSPLYNWRLTLRLLRSTDRLHPAGAEREGGMTGVQRSEGWIEGAMGRLKRERR